jgi:hypothetical protein
MLDLSAWTDQSQSESERTWQLSKSLCQILLQIKIEPAHLLSVTGSIDKSPLHSSTIKKAKQKRKLVLTPDFVSWALIYRRGRKEGAQANTQDNDALDFLVCEKNPRPVENAR